MVNCLLTKSNERGEKEEEENYHQQPERLWNTGEIEL